MHAGAGAQPGDNLVADPHAGARRDFEAVDEAAADDEDGAAGPGKGRVVAEAGDCAADGNGGDDVAEKVGDRADAGFFGGGAFDGLEVEGEVVDVAGGTVNRFPLYGKTRSGKIARGESLRVQAHGQKP